jgi:transmembrane sensor
MSADPHAPDAPLPEPILDQAALWLARRDRGLSAAEQDDYAQWLAADPRHRAAMARHSAALERMMRLYEWQPAHTRTPNPDLLAPAPRRGWRWPVALGAAAVLVLGGLWFSTRPAAAPRAEPVARSYLRVNERIALPDGSRIELKDGSAVVVQYSETERRVLLTGGEAHFSVWKDPVRPFVVDAGGVAVRAVGTAFNVRRGPTAVEVLVTSGRVEVRPPETAADAAPLPLVSAGELAVVSRAPGAGAERAAIKAVSADEIGRALEWQTPRLEFDETPLVTAVAEFNRLNRHQLTVGDPELHGIAIGGTFRPDNVEGFVRLLELTFRIRGEKRGDHETVLLPRR